MKLFICFALFAVFATTVSAFTCTGPESCSYHGNCITKNNASVCLCDEDWVTYDGNGQYDPNTVYPDDVARCNHKKKSKLTAFLLELLLPLIGVDGVGWLTIGHIAMGVCRMLYAVVGIIVLCFFFCCFVCAGASESDAGMGVVGCGMACFSCLWVIGYIIWWLWSVIVIATDKVDDWDGVPLRPDM